MYLRISQKRFGCEKKRINPVLYQEPRTPATGCETLQRCNIDEQECAELLQHTYFAFCSVHKDRVDLVSVRLVTAAPV